ncbi:hypothetical protein H0H93_007268 [Arthromyces matolae]|nr:hypothetical protein H0H93_007268 [Arthromyces matolae]
MPTTRRFQSLSPSVSPACSRSPSPIPFTPIPSRNMRRTRSSTIAPTPRISSSTPSTRHISQSDRIKELESRIADLEDQLTHAETHREFAEAQRNAAEVHAVFAIREAATLRQQAHRRAEKKDGHGRRIHVNARVMTSEEGLRMCEEDRAAREEKERQKREKQSKRDAVNKENVVRRETYGATMVFSGSLSSKNKTQLGDLAAALGFETQLDDKRTKAQFLEQITKKFEAEPELKDDPRFVGMFKRGSKRPAAEPDPDSLRTPLQRRRLDINEDSGPSQQQFSHTTQSSYSHLRHSPIPGPSGLASDPAHAHYPHSNPGYLHYNTMYSMPYNYHHLPR